MLARGRSDVLVFETTPLTEALEIIGPITAVLYVSSSCVDTDFTAALSVVTAEGCAAALCEGIARVRYRSYVQPVAMGEGSTDEALLKGIIEPDEHVEQQQHGGTGNPHLMEAGEVYEIVVDMWDTAIRFGAGEKLRVDISSSNFPRYDRNLNTGGRVGFEEESAALVSRNDVFCCARFPSRLLLPTQDVGQAEPSARGKL